MRIVSQLLRNEIIFCLLFFVSNYVKNLFPDSNAIKFNMTASVQPTELYYVTGGTARYKKVMAKTWRQ